MKRKAKDLGGCAPDSKPNMTSIIVARRGAVDREVEQSLRPVVTRHELQDLTADAWNPKMQAEEDHMNCKRARRLMETVAAGGNPNSGSLGGLARAEIVGISVFGDLETHATT